MGKAPKTRPMTTADLVYKAHEYPALRIAAAIENKTNENLCFVVGGGIGDRVCAEPTLRFALEFYKNVSLICETPELFAHLQFKEVFDLKKSFPIIGRHLYLHTYPETPLINQFVNANLTHCIDYPSLAALRIQLPPSFKAVQAVTQSQEGTKLFDIAVDQKSVLVHPGKTWPSRTFPAKWWSGVVEEVLKRGKTPVLIGNQTVDGVDSMGGVDLRGKTTLSELYWLCLHAGSLITNDSSPLHLAAAGRAKIAYVATCRRGDLLIHPRWGGYGWRMKDFGKNEMWKDFHLCPNVLDEVHINEVPRGTIEDYLPEPWEILDWVDERV